MCRCQSLGENVPEGTGRALWGPAGPSHGLPAVCCCGGPWSALQPPLPGTPSLASGGLLIPGRLPGPRGFLTLPPKAQPPTPVKLRAVPTARVSPSRIQHALALTPVLSACSPVGL